MYIEIGFYKKQRKNMLVAVETKNNLLSVVETKNNFLSKI